MPFMKKEDIAKLASMARIRVTDEETEGLVHDIDAVLAYVGTINDMVADSEMTKKVGPVHNVFREDEATNVPDSYTDTILKEAPNTEGRFLKVKKILQQD